MNVKYRKRSPFMLNCGLNFNFSHWIIHSRNKWPLIVSVLVNAQKWNSWPGLFAENNKAFNGDKVIFRAWWLRSTLGEQHLKSFFPTLLAEKNSGNVILWPIIGLQYLTIGNVDKGNYHVWEGCNRFKEDSGRWKLRSPEHVTCDDMADETGGGYVHLIWYF